MLLQFCDYLLYITNNTNTFSYETQPYFLSNNLLYGPQHNKVLLQTFHPKQDSDQSVYLCCLILYAGHCNNYVFPTKALKRLTIYFKHYD